MTIKVSIIEDSEIRKQIKDMITGQVKNIIREEFSKIIDDEVYRLLQTFADTTKLETTVADVAQKLARGEWLIERDLKKNIQKSLTTIHQDRIDKMIDKVDMDEIVSRIIRDNIVSRRSN